MKKLCLLFLLTFSFGIHAKTSERIFKMNTSQECFIRTVIETPDNEKSINADMLFFIGFGDRADNHDPLFKLLNEQGIRVISFDYPTHGDSRCGHIDWESFHSLSILAQEIEEKTRQDVQRPLFISGWSTGGILALSMIQHNFFAERFIKGLVLITPGVSVYNFVGGDGIIREKTLSQNPNPPHKGPISPLSPFFAPLFATNIKFNSRAVRSSHLPTYIPMLVLAAGDKLDKYVRTKVLKEWITKSKNQKKNLYAFQCENSMHEMDNEIEPIGSTVRNLIKDFVNGQDKTLVPTHQDACKSI